MRRNQQTATARIDLAALRAGTRVDGVGIAMVDALFRLCLQFLPYLPERGFWLSRLESMRQWLDSTPVGKPVPLAVPVCHGSLSRRHQTSPTSGCWTAWSRPALDAR